MTTWRKENINQSINQSNVGKCFGIEKVMLSSDYVALTAKLNLLWRLQMSLVTVFSFHFC